MPPPKGPSSRTGAPQPRHLQASWHPAGRPDLPAHIDLCYVTHGTLAADRRNAIVLPTYYTGTHDSYLPWIGPGRPFDTDRWYVVVPNLVGNSRSTIQHVGSGRAWDPRTDPAVSIRDNVDLQLRLLQHLGVEHVALVAGWSMGGVQAYAWAAAHPELVDAILPVCATSRCWPLNDMFLEGLVTHLDHALDRPAHADAGLRGFGRAYASWAYSSAYFRDELWRGDGYTSREDLRAAWEADHLTWDAADLLMMLRTWQSADPTRPGETFQQSLRAVSARAIVMPSTSDLYFTLEENEHEAQLLPHGQLRPLVSRYGHIAGRPGHRPDVTDAVAAAAQELLAPPVPAP